MDTFESATAFANTAVGLLRYLTGAEGMGIPRRNVLWLFDTDETATEQIDRIDEFLARHIQLSGSRRGRGLLILFVYVGHGAFFGTDRAYCLLLRDTHKPGLSQTSLRVADLAETLRSAAPESSRVVVLDSCFAGVAFKDFQSDISQLASVKIDEALENSCSTRGVALLCAASSRNPARLAARDSTTLFGQALLHVLHTGDSARSGPMSLRRLCELCELYLDGQTDNPPRPEVHSPDQHDGDLAAVPLFPNPAGNTNSTDRFGDAEVQLHRLSTAAAPRTTAQARPVDTSQPARIGEASWRGSQDNEAGTKSTFAPPGLALVSIATILGLIAWGLSSLIPDVSTSPPSQGSGNTTVASGQANTTVGSAVGPTLTDAVTVFSPEGTPDSARTVSSVLDGNPASEWRTDIYFQQFPR